MSAEQVAGPKAQGCRGPDREVYWHGVQGGHVALKGRQLRVAKPRLRKKRRLADGSGEVEVPLSLSLLQGRPFLASLHPNTCEIAPLGICYRQCT